MVRHVPDRSRRLAPTARTSPRSPWEPDTTRPDLDIPVRFMTRSSAQFQDTVRGGQPCAPMVQMSTSYREWIIKGTLCGTPEQRWLLLNAAACKQLGATPSTPPPFAVGIPDVGWHPVLEAVVVEDLGKPMSGLLLRMGRCLGLPQPRYVFSQYDAGHTVVAVCGPWMGRAGTVVGPRRGPRLTVADASDVFELAPDEVAALPDGGPVEALVPLSVRLPVDAPAWAVIDNRVHRIVVGEAAEDGTMVEVWSLEDQCLSLVPRSRALLAERVEGEPCPLTPPVPKNRKVPRSKRSPAQEPKLDGHNIQASLDAIDRYLGRGDVNPFG